MTVKLNELALAHARQLIEEGRFVADRRTDWSEHQPSAEQENDFIKGYGWSTYGLWYLGINDDRSANTKGYFEFPYGDFQRVHRCGLLSAEGRAGQYGHLDIEAATIELLKLMDKSTLM
ncbi:hypothetical protein DK867_21230 [Ochrobactrum sp. POC9]|nr:hypothetical protein DK867_21230 [Ochrobactrum sp. POC9]